ncbi:MAG: DEAD/DEAH box helicase family protein [Cytophagales bacterium]|nr:DEAD/DEAH box helicase family protein [Cytophagales bacterium]
MATNPALKQQQHRITLSPKPHQLEAINKAVQFYHTNRSGKLIMPCGSGKSLTALWIADAIGAKRIVVVLPTLQLQSQMLNDWFKNIHSDSVDHNVLIIGSDQEMGCQHDLKSTTDPLTILSSLKRSTQKPVVILTTYHSSPILLKIATANEISFDLCVFDEAHHTVGLDKKKFQAVIKQDKFKVNKRLFMTATPRVLQARVGQHDMELISMDDETIYGKEFYRLDTREAISKGIICDYKVVTMYSAHHMVNERISNNRLIADRLKRMPNGESRMIAIGLSIIRSFQKLGLRHTIGFTSSIARNEEFAIIIKALCQAANYHIDVFDINNTHSAAERSHILNSFSQSQRALIINSKLLGEGFDMPAVDAVAFVDEKSSVTDIVQAAGRCWRLSPGKKYGYILLPILLSENQETINTSETLILRRVISALMTTDDLILDFFKSKTSDPFRRGKIANLFDAIDLPSYFNVDLMIESIKPSVWRSASLLAFKDTVWAPWYIAAQLTMPLAEFGIINYACWERYCKDPSLYPGAPEKPSNIPVNLAYFYKEDYKAELFFLDGRSRSSYRTHDKSAQFTLHLGDFGIINSTHWIRYCKDHTLYPGALPKPSDIPVYLWEFYKDKYKAELFFSAGRSEYSWRSAKAAAIFVRSLFKYGVTNTRHWIKYWRNHLLYPGAPKCPNDIPLNLALVYKSEYNVNEFFPQSKVVMNYAQVDVAIAFVISLWKYGVVSTRHWVKYCKDHTLYPGAPKKPSYIPSALRSVYKQGYSASLFFPSREKKVNK